MNQLNAQYFDGQSAAALPVQLSLVANRLAIVGENVNILLPLDDTSLSPRLGQTRRQIKLPEQAMCELEDSPILDRWYSSANHRRWNILAMLEAHWPAVVVSVVLVIGVITITAIWGLPWAAKKIAPAVPQTWVNYLGAGTLTAMDETLGGTTDLSETYQENLQRKFTALVGAANVGAHFEFRSWPQLGANALALPDGTIVITDRLVGLADDDRELLAVIAHELGHVHERHSLQKVLSSSSLAAIIFVLTGDVSGLSSVVVAAPTLMLHLRHSRQLEAEADEFAFSLLEQEGLGADWFARIILKLEAEKGDDSRDNECEKQVDDCDDSAQNWLASHPASAERARRAEGFAAE